MTRIQSQSSHILVYFTCFVTCELVQQYTRLTQNKHPCPEVGPQEGGVLLAALWPCPPAAPQTTTPPTPPPLCTPVQPLPPPPPQLLLACTQAFLLPGTYPLPILAPGSYSRLLLPLQEQMRSRLLQEVPLDQTLHLRQPKHPCISSTDGFITLYRPPTHTYTQPCSLCQESSSPNKLLLCLKQAPLITHSLLHFLSCPFCRLQCVYRCVRTCAFGQRVSSCPKFFQVLFTTASLPPSTQQVFT